jgi:hypothetical protein
VRSQTFVTILLFGVFFTLFQSADIGATGHPDKPIVIKLQDAKMPPVTFSHTTHVNKNKIECVKCHHKDPQAPKVCTTCHDKEAKGNVVMVKEAFHNTCQACHKESVAKGGTAPTKCTECHKK